MRSPSQGPLRPATGVAVQALRKDAIGNSFRDSIAAPTPRQRGTKRRHKAMSLEAPTGREVVEERFPMESEKSGGSENRNQKGMSPGVPIRERRKRRPRPQGLTFGKAVDKVRNGYPRPGGTAASMCRRPKTGVRTSPWSPQGFHRRTDDTVRNRPGHRSNGFPGSWNCFVLPRWVAPQ